VKTAPTSAFSADILLERFLVVFQRPKFNAKLNKIQ
jgi:hypothetical protein